MALKVAIVAVVVLLLLTVLSPLGLLAAAVLFGISLIGLPIRLAQRRSVKGWGIVAGASLVFIFVFADISDALYGSGLSGSPTTGSKSTPNQNGTYKQSVPSQANNGPSPELQQAMSIIERNPSNYAIFSSDLLNTTGIYDENWRLTDKGKSQLATTLCRALTYAVAGSSAANRSQPIDPSKVSRNEMTLIEVNLQMVGLPITGDRALIWAQACQKDPKNWWRHT